MASQTLPDISDVLKITPATIKIGESPSADVYVTLFRGERVVVKVIRSRSNHGSKKLKETLLDVGAIWYLLSHPNIVPFMGVAYLRCENYPISLVTHYCEHDNVIKYLRITPNADIMHLVRGVVEGVLYLHSRAVTHTNLHGSNVLVSKHGNAVLTDIGINGLNTDSRAGPGRWQAPEVYRFEGAADESPFTHASDIYSFAILLVEMITLQQPFNCRRLDAHVYIDVTNGRRPDKPEGISVVGEMLWPLMVKCWHQDPANRPDISTIHAELHGLLV